MLIGDFSTHHLRPIETTESTAREIFDLFIRELDPDGMVLKETDIAALKIGSNDLFSQISAGNDDYMKKAQNIYRKALITTDSIFTVISSKTLNYNEKDSITFLGSSKKVVYSANTKQLANRLNRYVKSICLNRALSVAGSDSLSDEEFYKKAREFSKDVIQYSAKGILQELAACDALVESSLLNAIAMRYDPHSNYFTYEQNKKFSKQLSAHVESFGFSLTENDDGAIEIGDVEPGGSAWMSNEMNKGDLFVSMKIGNKHYSSDDSDVEELQDIIDNSDDKMLTITLTKKSGVQKIISLIKRKIESDENYVKGYILKGNQMNVGYISLPSFYTEMDDPNIPGCANDVAKEILKLENDSIQGLILDLRNNGGGSMLEAMNLAGIFIDEGPLFIYKQKNLKPTLVKDINRGVVFKKPIIVMINEFSASASELFSNVVKDYNLGLVVGQTSYGKGTAQFVLPLDTTILNKKHPNLNDKMDFVKITNARFYRLNCSTHQGIGVTPHIPFPSSMSAMKEYKENSSSFYLPPDSVVKKITYTPKSAFDYASVKDKSLSRQNASVDFKTFKLYSDSISNFIVKPSKIALNRKAYGNYKNRVNRLTDKFEEANTAKNNSIISRNNTFDKKLYEVNPGIQEFNKRVLQSIQKDLFINESFLILNDLINQKNQ